MFKTLRNQLILTHVLPILLITPIIGLAMVFIFETRFLLPDLSRQATVNARLIAQLTSDHLEIWRQPLYAQLLLQRLSQELAGSVRLVSPDGLLLASSENEDAGRIRHFIDLNGLSAAQEGQTVTFTSYDDILREDVVEVLAPVYAPSGGIIGIIWLTNRFASAYRELADVRYLVIGVLVLGVASGVLLGYWLALSIGQPVERVTQAVYDLAHGSIQGSLPEQGPEEIRMLLRAVNYLDERFKNLERARRQLLANLVHELGRPLGALLSAVQALGQGADRDPNLYRDLIDGMAGEIDLLQNLLEELAHLYEQVLGTLELNRQSINLRDWLTKILAPWREAAHEKNIHWSEQLPPELPVIDVDPDRLDQVLGNLISNALKYTPARGGITVAAGESGNEVWIEVKDSGIGVGAEERERIFEPFYRGKKGRRFPQGMGLGLSIANDLVKAHDGRIELETTEGQGSCFRVVLPVSKK